LGASGFSTAAGGKVRKNPNGLEAVLAKNITLNQDGEIHPMYKNKKKSFNALCWHYDEAEKLPKETKVLASNKISQFQSISFEVNQSSVWAVQYHPEFNSKWMAGLMEMRKDILLEQKIYENLSEFEITENFSCVRFLDQNKERFELEFNLEKGTSFNTFFIRSHEELFIIHPPEKQYLDSFNKVISRFCDQFKLDKINFISGHINPKIIETIKNISTQFQNTTITCSNPGYKLISELWNQRNPTLENFIEIQLPKINIVKKEQNLELDNISLELIPIPTARWPGGLIIYERNQEILLSEKIFSAHIASSDWSETNRVSTEIDRKHFYDCLMAPMSNQVVSITEKISDYDIKTIAPLHGPAIEYSLKSFLNDYIRWGENLSTNNPKIALIYASAYGNTASIGDALAKGINRTSVEVESINCEFTPNEVLIKSIKNADGYLIGSPTLGGHAPTPIVSALGTLLSEGN